MSETDSNPVLYFYARDRDSCPQRYNGDAAAIGCVALESHGVLQHIGLIKKIVSADDYVRKELECKKVLEGKFLFVRGGPTHAMRLECRLVQEHSLQGITIDFTVELTDFHHDVLPHAAYQSGRFPRVQL